MSRSRQIDDLSDAPIELTDELADTGERVRFSGIVDADGGPDASLYDGVIPIPPNEQHWDRLSRQIWLISRLTAVALVAASLIGLPLGSYLAHIQLYGSTSNWSLFSAWPANLLFYTLFGAALTVLIGYIMRRMFTMVNAAESIAAAAQQLVTPEGTAVANVNSVGAVVHGHVNTLNEGIDSALSRLASIEAMIRQHVEAIEIAGEAIEHRATDAVSRVANERSRLMELTENLNTHADSFAVAIAERANTSIEALRESDALASGVEKDFDDRLGRLETAARKAFESFESLRDALRETEQSMQRTAGEVDKAASMTLTATEKATTAANAAAEGAAVNAANAIAAANRAGDKVKEATDAVVSRVVAETEKVTEAALTVASEESEKIKRAASQTLHDVTDATKAAIDGAAAEAARANEAAAAVTEAARKTGEAAAKASADVASASEQARQTADQAAEYANVTADKTEARNKALESARADLEQENARLEALIEEQRKRADRLADAIATQTERLSRLAETQLREQEAAMRIAEAQNELDARRAEEEKRAAEEKAAEEAAKAEAEAEAARARAEKAKAEKEKAEADARESLTKQSAAQKKHASPNGSAARLDELAEDIAQRRKPTKRPPTEEPISLGDDDKTTTRAKGRSKKQVSWREILDAADVAEPIDLTAEAQSREARTGKPLPPASADNGARAIKIISDLQAFTYDLETRLYGEAPPALKERFENGDRNVFANRLLRLNEADVKRRIRTESGRDKAFERGIQSFLQGFETLLEDATTSETADEELEQYLSSPLGRVYLLIGATVGYFA